MIIHLRNENDARNLTFDVLAKAYLVTYDNEDNSISVVKWRNAPERLFPILKHGGTSSISIEDYYELRDFIVETYYPKSNPYELNNDCGFIHPPPPLFPGLNL